MAEEYELDFEDTTPEGMKNLRKAYNKVVSDLKTERESNSDLRGFKRNFEIGEKLKSLKADPGIAELVPASVEVDNVGQWLTEKAALFGWKPETASDPANAAEAASQGRIAAITPVDADGGEDPDLAAVKAAKSPQELMELIYAAQMGKR